MRTWIGVLLVLLLAPAAQSAEETLYVRAQASVAVLSTPAAEATIVRRLTPGDSVAVLGREAGFVHVRVNDTTQGWMRETDLTAVAPPAQRVAQLEGQVDELRQQRDAAQASLRRAQSELQQAQQAQQAAAAARNSGADETSALQAERDALQQSLAASNAELASLRTRVAELEMAREAAELLAEQQPAAADFGQQRFSRTELVIAAATALLLAFAGIWVGMSSSRRRLRQRYHGLEL